MEVTYFEFCKSIAEDFGIELMNKQKKYINQFPIKNGRRKINSFRDAVIVSKDGNEHPYMLSTSGVRNEKQLIDFDYIYIKRAKSLNQIVEEAGIALKSKPCKICEGSGFHSKGTRYFYKNIYCEN